MGNQEEKRLLDEIIKLKQQNALLSAQNAGFAAEKSNMLCTIAILVDRDGGRASITQLDGPFIADWLAGKVVLDVVSGELNMVSFTVRRADGQSEQPHDAPGSADAGAPGSQDGKVA